jgi:hypothetical protein
MGPELSLPPPLNQPNTLIIPEVWGSTEAASQSIARTIPAGQALQPLDIRAQLLACAGRPVSLSDRPHFAAAMLWQSCFAPNPDRLQAALEARLPDSHQLDGIGAYVLLAIPNRGKRPSLLLVGMARDEASHHDIMNSWIQPAFLLCDSQLTPLLEARPAGLTATSEFRFPVATPA